MTDSGLPTILCFLKLSSYTKCSKCLNASENGPCRDETFAAKSELKSDWSSLYEQMSWIAFSNMQPVLKNQVDAIPRSLHLQHVAMM